MKKANTAKNDALTHDAKMNFGGKGWWIIILAGLTMGAFCSVQSLSMNVVPGAMVELTGVSEATLRAINTPAGIVGLFVALALSWLANKWRLKWVHVLSLLITAVACIAWAYAKSFVAYAIPVFVMYGLMSSTEIVTGKMLANWFPRKKGVATGISTIGLNIASIVMPGLLVSLSVMGGAKYVLFVLAGILVVFAILAIVAYKDYPEQWGAYPDNDPNAPRVQEVKTGWTTKKVFAQKSTWLIAIATGLFAMTTFGYVSSAIPSMLAKGVPMGTAALMMTVASIFGAVGSYGAGFIDQKFGVKRSAIIMCVILIIGMSMFRINSMGGAWAFTVIMGLTIGAANNYPISMTAQVYGRGGFSVAYAAMCLPKGVLQFSVYLIQAWSINKTGGYGPCWLVLTGLIVVAIVVFALCDVNPKPDPIELAETVE